MREVAALTGVSIKSVSRVLNDEGGVSPATAARVRDVAASLGFRRNELARGLRNRSGTGTIGLVLKHSSTRFYSDLIRGVEEVAERRGVLVLTATCQTIERERDALVALASRRVDGLIVVPTGDDLGFLEPDRASGLPIVFADRPARGIAADTVLNADRAGGRAAARHLAGHGHARIAVIGARAQLHTVRERLAGFRAGLQDAGPAVRRDLVRLGVETGDESATVTSALLDDPALAPTALFTLNNVCTIGAVRELHRRELQRSVALVGFDDFELADVVRPAITVIAHDVVALGRLAAERLFARIDGDDAAPRRTTLPVRLVARGSGEIAPVPAGFP